jgi:hypothetical protein
MLKFKPFAVLVTLVLNGKLIERFPKISITEEIITKLTARRFSYLVMRATIGLTALSKFEDPLDKPQLLERMIRILYEIDLSTLPWKSET